MSKFKKLSALLLAMMVCSITLYCNELYIWIKFKEIPFGATHTTNNMRTLPKTPKRAFMKRNANGEQDNVPRIIHQIWKDYNIPSNQQTWMQSWRKNHPHWEYWFWTDRAAEKFLKVKFPQFLPVYNSYKGNLYRADVLRYFILYQYGGVYADLDMISLKPLDIFFYKRRHSCVLSQEPYEHSIIMNYIYDGLPCNAFMASIPKHPFFKFVTSYFMKTSPNKINSKTAVESTGPKALRALYNIYNESDGKPVYVAKPEEFIPSFDPWLGTVGNLEIHCKAAAESQKRSRKISLCKKESSKACSILMEQVQTIENICSRLLKMGFRNAPVPKTAFADHKWIHTYAEVAKIKTVNVSSILNNVTKVEEMFD